MSKKILKEGTGNFYNKNASNIFSVSTNYVDEETGEEVYDEFIFDDTIESVKAALKVKFASLVELNERDNDRNHSGLIFGSDFEYTENNYYSVEIKCIARNGYYEGFNLDWEIEIENQYFGSAFDFNDIDVELEDDFIEGYVRNNPDDLDLDDEGLEAEARKKIPAIKNEIENIAQELISQVEEVYSMYSDKLTVAARFSNGETMYNRVNENVDVKRAIKLIEAVTNKKVVLKEEYASSYRNKNASRVFSVSENYIEKNAQSDFAYMDTINSIRTALSKKRQIL